MIYQKTELSVTLLMPFNTPTEEINIGIEDGLFTNVEESLNTGLYRPEKEKELAIRNCSRSRSRSRSSSRSKTNKSHRIIVNSGLIFNYEFNPKNRPNEGPFSPPNSPVESLPRSPAGSRSDSPTGIRSDSPTGIRSDSPTGSRSDSPTGIRSDSPPRNRSASPNQNDSPSLNGSTASQFALRSPKDWSPKPHSTSQVRIEYPEPETECGRCFYKLTHMMKIKKGFLADNLLTNWKLDSSIEVDLHNLTMLKRNQIRRLKYLVQVNRAYSLYYYNKGLYWKRVYWISNFLGLLLAGSMTIVNMLYNPCSTNPDPNNPRYSYNIILGAVITTGMAIIAFTDASSRRRQYEDAGDEYKVLAIDIYREAFFSNQAFQERDLNEIIDEYSIRMEAYSKIYEEPPLREILKILEQPEFDMNIEITNRV